MPITQFNNQAALMQMQLMERARLGQVPGQPGMVDGVQDVGPNQANLSRGQLRNQWEGALGARPQQDSKANFEQAFGGAYIKDFNSDNARALLSQAASAIAQSGVPGSQELAQTLAQGAADPRTVNKGAIQKLQSFLQSQGCSVGEAGTDGKLGPDTFNALNKFMSKGRQQAGAAGSGGAPGNIPPGFTYVGRQDQATGRFIPAGMDQLNRMQSQQNPAVANQYWA